MSRRCTSEPLSRWTCPDLATEAAAQGITTAISASTIHRIVVGDAIKPWHRNLEDRAIDVDAFGLRGRAHVMGLCSDTTGIDPFMDLVE